MSDTPITDEVEKGNIAGYLAEQWILERHELTAANKRIEELEAENKRLREALEFYADPNKLKYIVDLKTMQSPELAIDAGKTARQTLNQKEDNQ